jgi:hypothetical protein
MLDALRKDPAVFARVEALPGRDTADPSDDWRREHQNSDSPRRVQLSGVRRMAADAGMDYVLLVGGTIDHGTSGTPLSILDLTIVGAFAVPSQETRATARASAALLDVQTGRVTFNSSAEARKSSLVPSAAVEGAETRLLEELRDEVVSKLGQQVLVDARSKAGATGVYYTK